MNNTNAHNNLTLPLLRNNNMQFKSQEERNAAVLKATQDLGKAFGEMKYQEYVLREVSQSFVPGQTQTSANTTSVATVVETKPVVEEKPATKTKTKSKSAPAPKKEEPVFEVNTEDTTTAEEPPVAMEVNTEDDTEAPIECPIKSIDDLRNLMMTKYNEGGKTPAVMAALQGALKESTGCVQAAAVKPEQFNAAYQAIVAVDLA